ncbi:MAG TPA: DUF4476 domain-containing protein [Flavipsychrobacter sp.]|nr:DUF4476 domain-containing protein [Flavipsychrobacter sp.]
MQSRNFIKYFGFIFLIVLTSFKTIAQGFSYVYIQGDKETPFYVKMEDQMQPRYGKNYCIISQLAPGPINIQILFQQNAYPPQKYTIVVPEDSYRGFLLVKKGETFSLYDLQQNFYLPEGNAAQDDHVPTNKPEESYITTAHPTKTEPDEQTQPDNNNASTENTKTTQTSESDNVATNTTTTISENQQKKEPQFINNLELNNQKTVQNNDENNSVANGDLKNNLSANIAVSNSDCPSPMDPRKYDELYKKMIQKGDKARLKYLMDKLDNCFTTDQVRMLARGLDNDPERYAFLKAAYSRVTDQNNFASLESLLSTQEWKGYFRLIMP